MIIKYEGKRKKIEGELTVEGDIVKQLKLDISYADEEKSEEIRIEYYAGNKFQLHHTYYSSKRDEDFTSISSDSSKFETQILKEGIKQLNLRFNGDLIESVVSLLEIMDAPVFTRNEFLFLMPMSVQVI